LCALTPVLRGLGAPAPGYPAGATAAAITFARQSREAEVAVHDRGWRQHYASAVTPVSRESTAAGR